jgi:ABC-type multidrug transport system fused ATPase/permease subunit
LGGDGTVKSLIFLVVMLMLCASLGLADPTAQKLKEDFARQGSTFTSMANVIVPDPIAWLRSTTEGITKLRLTTAIEVLAGLILFAGMVFSIWQAWYAANIKMIAGAFLRSILAGLCIMFCFNNGGTDKSFTFSSLLFNSWGAAYTWSVEKFGPTVDQTMEKSTEAMIDMLGEAVLVAGTVAVGGAAGKVATQGISRLMTAARSGGSLKDLMAMDGAGIMNTFFGGAGAGAMTSLRSGVATLLGRIQLMYAAILPILASYAAIVYFSGLLVLLGIIVLPLGFALIAWGQKEAVWMVFGTYLTALFSVIFLPLMLVVGLQIAFIQPTNMIKNYSAQMAAARYAANQLADNTSTNIQINYAAQVAACEAAQTADPQNGAESPACQKLRDANTNPLDLVGNAVTSIWRNIQSFFEDIWAGIMRVILAFVGVGFGLITSIALMFKLPSIFAGYLRGISERVQIRA